jgi:hypothetical protein
VFLGSVNLDKKILMNSASVSSNKDRQVVCLRIHFENAALTEIDEITQNRH